MKDLEVEQKKLTMYEPFITMAVDIIEPFRTRNTPKKFSVRHVCKPTSSTV